MTIINPFQEQKDKEARDGLIADTKNLARNLVLQHLISPSEAFDRAQSFMEEQTRRFMSDRNRNRWNAAKQQLEVSKIFDWYGEDFRLGHKGINSLAAFCARHADLLADPPADRERIRAMTAKVDFLDYDWKLNDAK